MRRPEVELVPREFQRGAVPDGVESHVVLAPAHHRARHLVVGQRFRTFGRVRQLAREPFALTDGAELGRDDHARVPPGIPREVEPDVAVVDERDATRSRLVDEHPPEIHRVLRRRREQTRGFLLPGNHRLEFERLVQRVPLALDVERQRRGFASHVDDDVEVARLLGVGDENDGDGDVPEGRHGSRARLERHRARLPSGVHERRLVEGELERDVFVVGQRHDAPVFGAHQHLSEVDAGGVQGHPRLRHASREQKRRRDAVLIDAELERRLHGLVRRGHVLEHHLVPFPGRDDAAGRGALERRLRRFPVRGRRAPLKLVRDVRGVEHHEPSRVAHAEPERDALHHSRRAVHRARAGRASTPGEVLALRKFEVTPRTGHLPAERNLERREPVVERGARERASNHAIAVHHLVGGEPNRHRHRLARGDDALGGFQLERTRRATSRLGARFDGEGKRKLRRAGVFELERVRPRLEHHRRAEHDGLDVALVPRVIRHGEDAKRGRFRTLLVRLDRRLGHRVEHNRRLDRRRGRRGRDGRLGRLRLDAAGALVAIPGRGGRFGLHHDGSPGCFRVVPIDGIRRDGGLGGLFAVRRRGRRLEVPDDGRQRDANLERRVRLVASVRGGFGRDERDGDGLGVSRVQMPRPRRKGEKFRRGSLGGLRPLEPPVLLRHVRHGERHRALRAERSILEPNLVVHVPRVVAEDDVRGVSLADDRDGSRAELVALHRQPSRVRKITNLARLERQLQRSRVSRRELCRDAAAHQREDVALGHVHATKGGEYAVVSKHDGTRRAATDHRARKSNHRRALLVQLRRGLDRDVRKRPLADDVARELFRLGIAAVHDVRLERRGVVSDGGRREVRRDVPVLVRRDVQTRRVHLHGERLLRRAALHLGGERELHRARHLGRVGDFEVGGDARARFGRSGRRVRVLARVVAFAGRVGRHLGDDRPEREGVVASGEDEPVLRDERIQRGDDLVFLEHGGDVVADDAGDATLAGNLVRNPEGLIVRVAIGDVHAREFDVVAIVLRGERHLDRGSLTGLDRSRGGRQREVPELERIPRRLGRRREVALVVALARLALAVVEQVKLEGKLARV